MRTTFNQAFFNALILRSEHQPSRLPKDKSLIPCLDFSTTRKVRSSIKVEEMANLDPFISRFYKLIYFIPAELCVKTRIVLKEIMRSSHDHQSSPASTAAGCFSVHEENTRFCKENAEAAQLIIFRGNSV